ncbi:alpha/beta hydrolase [Geodermatophilus sp. SYSU D01106]
MQSEPLLSWEACGLTPEAVEAAVQCAVADLPLDYDEPGGERVGIAVAKVPATDPERRIGSLFFNFGGPGGPAVDYLQSAGAGFFATLNERFDIVAFDPRGVGQSTPSIDCRADQERQGVYSMPFPTPLDIDVPAYVTKSQSYVDACLANNGEVLAHVSTANVARDMDALRAAVGDDRLTYLGFSYGTFLGSTYAALFPGRYRALVLDGAVNAEAYIDDPTSHLVAQTAAFEIALTRFTEACALDQVACSGFGGADPYLAFDNLIQTAEGTPIPAPGYTPDPRPVTGDDIRAATLSLLYAKQLWGILAQALAQAAAGDATLVRQLVDEVFYGRLEDGTFDPATDRYFTIGAAEQAYSTDVTTYLEQGAESWEAFPHFWFNSGYAEIPYALWPARDEDVYRGPFTVPGSSPTVLVIGTTYDPATPYQSAIALTAQLGNARLLTMEGDGHTAYGGNSACIDARTEAYLIELTLPEPGAECSQEVPFLAPEEPAEAQGTGVLTERPITRALLARER